MAIKDWFSINVHHKNSAMEILTQGNDTSCIWWIPNKVNIHVDEIHEFARDFMDQFKLGVMKVNHGYYFETVAESNTNF